MLPKTRSTPVHSPAPGVIPDTITGPVSDGSPVATDPSIAPAQRSAATGRKTQRERSRRKAYETNAGGAMMAGVKRGEDEAEFYREIVRRAKTVRERAAESLRRSRRLRKRQGNVGSPPDAAPGSRRRD
jgi:hypothetical protein